MRIFVDTCVLPRSHMEEGRIYRDRFGLSLGFELLPMFDLPDFEENLEKNCDLFAEGPLVFHEPVWGVEHSAPRGSKAYEDGMYHIQKTRHFARLLHPEFMVCHLNNCAVPPEDKDRMLKTSLENLEEMHELFPDLKLLVENTGTYWNKTMLLNQAEFTDLCKSKGFPVLVDTGHANANGWDIRKLILDLEDQICGFHLHNNDGLHDLHSRLENGTLDYPQLIPWISQRLPDVPMVIEYTRPVFHGKPLISDIHLLRGMDFSTPNVSAAQKEEETESSLPYFDPQRIACIFNNMDDAVCVTGKAGELLFSNPAARQLFGFKSTTGIRIWDAIPYVEGNDALIQLFIDSIMDKKKTVSSLVDYVGNNGAVSRLHVTLTCESEDSNILLIVISDLTRLVNVQSAFARYTSPEIADYVLNTPEGAKRGGQTKDVSIMMSDLRGFTALSTQMSSSELISILNNYFEQMSSIIQHYHGTVIEFLGDGIFVVFGAPDDLPDHAEMAVRCALEMQNKMVDVNQWNRQHGFPELEMGIGIHSGTVTVGNIGSDNKMKYGCIGEAVNMAGRIESFSVGGQIIISEFTKRLIPAEFPTANERSFTPKGGKTEIGIFDVLPFGETAGNGNTPPVEWKTLPEKKEVPYFTLSGKIVDKESHTGWLIRLSSDEKSGILATGSMLKPMTNLMLRIASRDVYAKVMGQEADGFLIRFTMKPEKLAELLS